MHTLRFGTVVLSLVLFTSPVLTAESNWERDKVCRDRAFRCALRCNEVTEGGSLARLQCYARCEEREGYCRKEGE